jgi:hypothetical protein
MKNAASFVRLDGGYREEGGGGGGGVYLVAVCVVVGGVDVGCAYVVRSPGIAPADSIRFDSTTKP